MGDSGGGGGGGDDDQLRPLNKDRPTRSNQLTYQTTVDQSVDRTHVQ